MNQTTPPDPSPAKPVRFECNAHSVSKSAAKNARRVQKRVYVAKSPIHGRGLFAATQLAADVTLGRLQGMLAEEDGEHILWLSKSLGMELTNEFRFINHSSNPNCAIVDVEVVTLRPIEQDEELTHDYGW